MCLKGVKSLRVGLVSLGCPKNLVDSENMLGILLKAGFSVTNDEKSADLLIVNTCAFIDEAKEESVKTILELARLKEEGSCRALLVTGCLAQRFSGELISEMPEIDGVIGTGDIPDIAVAAQEALSGKKIKIIGRPGYLPVAATPRLQSTPKYYAYLKIAEGCDNRCSYCVIPDIRGPFRSRVLADLVDEGAGLAAAGVRELILVAQDTTRYGWDLLSRPSLPELLKQLASIEGIRWLRLLYTYPALINDRLIETISSTGKVCRYLDLPLQHANARILKEMKRQGDSEQVIRLVEKLRAAIPSVTLRTTFITGFPGEREDEFTELLDLIREVKFDRVGVFAYSREEQTPAAALPDQIPEEIKLERQQRAMAVQQEISLERNRGKIGEIITVLMEGPGVGRSEGDAPEIDGKVFVHADKTPAAGEFAQVRITGASEYDLTGELVE